jgi:hypothetical protein
MSNKEYNPNDDGFLNKLKKIKDKEQQLVKYNETVNKAQEVIPLSEIKKQAKEYRKAKSRKISIILISLLILSSLLICIFICFVNKPRKELPLPAAPLPTQKIKDINVVYFSKTTFTPEINKNLIGYLDSLKTADSIDFFRFHIINSGDTLKSDNLYELVMELGNNQYEAKSFLDAGRLVRLSIEYHENQLMEIMFGNTYYDSNPLMFIGILKEHFKNEINNNDSGLFVDEEDIMTYSAIAVYNKNSTTEIFKAFLDVFVNVKKITD